MSVVHAGAVVGKEEEKGQHLPPVLVFRSGHSLTERHVFKAED